jgi:A/G-specific adenine glycosylase
MLQQTQVSRVLLKYPRFLSRFPSLKRLAKARTSDVIKSWEGMGYNSRALRLQKLAVIIFERYGGRLPENIQDLEALPGIGGYTAHALASFSFGQHVPVVDTNIKRVLTRVCRPKSRPSGAKKEDIWELAESLLPPRQSHDWNQALMDLGATICTAAHPGCDRCPLVDLCPSAHRVRRRIPATRKTEPGRSGIPNRIYRGRIIQTLRELKTRQSKTRSELARKVKPGFKSADRRWFESLLQGLASDGLIRMRSRNRISLPE